MLVKATHKGLLPRVHRPWQERRHHHGAQLQCKATARNKRTGKYKRTWTKTEFTRAVEKDALTNSSDPKLYAYVLTRYIFHPQDDWLAMRRPCLYLFSPTRLKSPRVLQVPVEYIVTVERYEH